MHILLTAATPFEVAPLLQWLESNFPIREDGYFETRSLAVFPLITGVGMTSTAFQLGRFLARQQPDLAINAGIAGALDTAFQLGDVLNVVTETFADLGVEETDGHFTDLFELGLVQHTDAPYVDGLLRNPASEKAAFLPAAQGMTVNKVHGSARSIAAIRSKYPDVQLESMEGAAFFYACLPSNIPFLEIRSVSNYVEPRNRENWNLPLAIDNLNRVLIEMIGSLDAPNPQSLIPNPQSPIPNPQSLIPNPYSPIPTPPTPPAQ